MDKPIDKIDTNKEEAKYNISPSSGIQNMPTKLDYKVYYENAYSKGYINGYLKGKKDQMQQKKGEWIATSEFEDCIYAKCNQCKVTQVFYYNKPLTNFCPNCGAHMGDKNDEDD